MQAGLCTVCSCTVLQPWWCQWGLNTLGLPFAREPAAGTFTIVLEQPEHSRLWLWLHTGACRAGPQVLNACCKHGTSL